MRIAGRIAPYALAALLGAGSPALAHHGLEPLLAGPEAPSDATPVSEHAGRITELVVEDRVLGVTLRYVGLAIDGGQAVRLKGASLAGLTAGWRVAVTGRLERGTLFVHEVRVLDMTARTQASAKRTSSVEGRYTLIHADNFEGGQSGWQHAVFSDAGATTLIHFPVMPDVLANGMRVEVSGALASDTIDAERVTILSLGPDASGSRDAGIQVNANVIAILVKFSDTASEPFTQAQTQSLFFGAAPTNSVARFFAEASYGQQTLSGVVTPWLTLAMARPTTCNFSGVGTAADAAASAAGFNLASYSHRVYLFPRISACGWSGLAYIGIGRAYINQSLSLLVVGHELGHNFGSLHAANLDCGTASVGGTCTSAEYGDEWSIMGNRRAGHPNAFQKLDLGWLTAGQVATHASGVATYTLSPLENAGGTTYAVRIPSRADRTYWLEFRQPIGFDSALSAFPNNGAQVRLATPFESICSGCADDTELLDMTPGTSAFTDGTLIAGRTYSDWDTGTNISVLSATASALQVRVARTAPRKRLDFNRDIKTDLVWRNDVTGTTSLWLMNGTAYASGAQLLTDPNWKVTHFGDFDGDRRADIVWRNDATGTSAVWLMNGTQFVAGATVMTNAQWRITHVADFNGDGRSDLVWRNDTTGATALWLMNGAAMASGSVLLTDVNWRVALVGDFDGDGRNDLFWRNAATGGAAVWLMNGTTMTAGAQLPAMPGWTATHAADFDADGRLDLVWRNPTSGTTSLWLMNGTQRLAQGTLVADPNWQATHVGDTNGDGRADIVWRNGSTGVTSLWLMDGLATLGLASLGSDPGWSVVGMSDQDGDSKADLLWRNATTGASNVWLMNGTTMTGGATLLTHPDWRVVVPE